MKTRFELHEANFEPVCSLPPRSVLFALPPAGVGTAGQESLLSLLVRTSHAHSVSPRQMIRKVLALHDQSISTLISASFFRTYSGTINGLGPYADLFASVMERLTGQKRLQHLTWLPWKDIFPRNGQGLLARHPRWCPACLLEQQRHGKETTAPLIWSLEVYRHCVEHRCTLEECCPHCGRCQPFIPDYPDLSRCAHCGLLLCADKPAEPVTPFQQWVATATANMAAHQSGDGFSPSLETLRKYLSESITSRANGNQAAFCRAIGMNTFALKGWLGKDQRPSLPQLLKVCYGMQVFPNNILTVSSHAVCKDLQLSPEQVMLRATRPQLKPEQRSKVEAILREKLLAVDSQPVSTIAAELGLSRHCLRYWFPLLCDLLAKRHLAYVKQRSLSHVTQQQAIVVELVTNMRNKGVYPSRRKVSKELRKHRMLLAQRHLLSVYRSAMAMKREF